MLTIQTVSRNPLRCPSATCQFARTIGITVLCCCLVASTMCSAADQAGPPAQEIKVALIGDSTVTDTSGWGRTFPDHFKRDVEVLNFAKGGRSSKSWYDEKLLPAVLRAKPDYVFVQFGHNDQPGKGPQRETDPRNTYRDFLRLYVTRFREIGATPILVSYVARRRFTPSGKVDSSLTPWAEATRAVAQELNVPFVDLHSASIALYEKLGREESMSFNPKEGDITHFNRKGSQAISSLIVSQLDKACKPLAARLK